MAKKVKIDIETRGNASGAKKVDNALDDVADSAEKVKLLLENTEGLDPKVRTQIEGLGRSMEQVAKTGKKVQGGMGKTAKSTRNGGLAFLEFSRAVEDAQYGMRGVLNNIPQMVLLMGGTGGLAGVISVAAVAMSQLVTRMTQVEKETEESAETVDVLRQRFVDLQKALAEDDFQSYLVGIRAVDEAITLENRNLTANIRLLGQKRRAELELAAIQDDVDLARIAQRELTDPDFTPAQAISARSEVERRRVQRAAQVKIEEAEVQISEASERRAIAVQELAEKEQTLLRLKQEEERLQNERNALESKRNFIASKFEAEADKVEENSSFLTADVSAKRALSLRNRARSALPAEEKQRLANINDTILPGVGAEIGNAKDDIEQTRRKIMNLGASLDEVSVEARQTRQNAEAVEEATLELNEITEQTAITKDNIAQQKNVSSALSEAMGEMRDGVQKLDDFSNTLNEGAAAVQSGIGSLNQKKLRDAQLVDSLLTSIRDAISDNQLSVEELEGISQKMSNTFGDELQLLGNIRGIQNEHQRTLANLRRDVNRALAIASRAR